LNRVIRATTIFNVNNTRPRAFLLFSEMTTGLLYALLCVLPKQVWEKIMTQVYGRIPKISQCIVRD
jgi:hypothetical protein